MTVKAEFPINAVELEVKYLYNHLNAAAICSRTSATQFSAMMASISTLEPITGRKSEKTIPQNIDGSRTQNTRGNVSKITVNLTCYGHIGSKSTNHSH